MQPPLKQPNKLVHRTTLIPKRPLRLSRIQKPQDTPQPAPKRAIPTSLTKQSDPPRQPKIVIVHDWLIGGGAERLVEQLHTLYPDAPIYTSYCTKEWRKRLGQRVKTGYLQYWPFSRLRKFLPILRIWWFSRLNLKGYDLVISSSGSGEAKAVRASGDAVHITYCHAPTHFYWSRYAEYMAHPGFGMFDWLARFGLRTFVSPLRRWDYKTAQLPDYILTNSSYTQAGIQRYYDRNAVIIHPPVDTARFKGAVNTQKRRGFIIAGRQTPYKRFDLAVAACTKLNISLTVIGDGPEHKQLRKIAGPTVTFLGKVSDELMAEELGQAKGFIFPGVDDFGIVAVEAMAAGTPVIAYKDGGALDYVQPGVTGLFFEEQTIESLTAALRKFVRQRFDPIAVSHAAEQFSAARFQQKMRLFVRRALAKRSKDQSPQKPSGILRS